MRSLRLQSWQLPGDIPWDILRMREDTWHDAPRWSIVDLDTDRTDAVIGIVSLLMGGRIYSAKCKMHADCKFGQGPRAKVEGDLQRTATLLSKWLISGCGIDRGDHQALCGTIREQRKALIM